jgi:hypothetical protein
VLFKITFCGIACGFTAMMMKEAAITFPLLPQIFMSVCAGGLMFVITGFLTGVLSKNVIKRLFE